MGLCCDLLSSRKFKRNTTHVESSRVLSPDRGSNPLSSTKSSVKYCKSKTCSIRFCELRILFNAHFLGKNFEMNKKIFLTNYGGDLSKRWYVRWTERNKANRSEIKKAYGNINKGKSIQERTELAKQLIAQIQQDLYTPNYKWKHQTTHQPLAPPANTLHKEFHKAIENIRPTLRQKTYYSYISKIRIFLNWTDAQGLKKLTDLTPDNIKSFFNHLLDKGRNNTTHNTYITSIKRLAKEIDKFDMSIFKKVKKLQKDATPAAYFQEHQIKLLQSVVKNEHPQLWLACQMMFFTLIRPGELRLLKVGDIRLGDATILVRSDISKNKKTECVAIPNSLMDIFTEMNLYNYSDDFYLFGCDGIPGAKHRKKNYFQTQHLKFLRKLKFDTKRYKFYSWKHTGAVQMVKNGIHIKYIQVQGRWHDLDQVNSYLRQLGMIDMKELKDKHVMNM